MKPGRKLNQKEAQDYVFKEYAETLKKLAEYCPHHKDNIIHYIGSGLPNGMITQCRNCEIGWDKNGSIIPKCLHKNVKLLYIIDDDHDDRKYKCKDCGKVFISEGIDS